jgi:osmoprotectant transport system permease protein
MPDTIPEKTKNDKPLTQRFPVSTVIWVVLGILTFMVSTQVVTLRDQERFTNDFAVDTVATETDNTVRLNITAGTFEYNVSPFESDVLETGTFTIDDVPTGNSVADRLFDGIPDVTDIVIESQTITITYDNDIEADLMVRRAQRPVQNAVLNEAVTITSAPAENAEMTFVFSTTDEAWTFGEFTPNLIPEGTEEVYADRASMEAGSPLAQFIAERISSVEGLTLAPDHLLVTYREGAVENQVVNRIVDALNDFHPRASLGANWWVMTISGSADTILAVVPIDTGIPLYLYAFVIALIELIVFYAFRNSDDKLVRPLLRVVVIFLFVWSIYGHEPLWDYILGGIFPTSAQLIHPNGTVIEFTAQHLELVFVSSLITIPAGLLFGIVVTRDEFRELLPLVNNLVNSGQTVPTIAIVAFMAPIIGFGFWPAIIALVAYGLLPVVRNTIAGLEAVDDFIIDSARGMGMTPMQILFQIELPIASSIIMAGIRTSMVINVGTATLGAFVGSGGLGTPIASGLSMTIDSFILLGAIPAAVLAILIDYVLGRIEFVLTPRGLQIA